MAERTQPVRAPHPKAPARASTARVALPAEGFALATLFERVPDVRIECEPAITNPDDHALLVIRTDNGERSTVETAILSDAGVAAVEFLTERDDGWTYRVTWKGRPHDLVQHLVAVDVTILSMRGQNGEWKLRLLTPDRKSVSRAHDIMAELDCDATYLRISTFDGDSSESGLTDEQREALTAAFEAGYYDIPRSVTADELADELGISHQALSERFRRAYQHMVEDELIVDKPRA